MSQATDANLVEIFSSLQGEGPHVGVSTLFVRFGECDLRCGWCDSVGTWQPAPRCRIERIAGSGEFDETDNPVSAERVAATADALGGARVHRFASLTGGEPLLQPEAVAGIAERLRATGLEIYLETHGLHASALARVVEHVDCVSMDWKFASDVRRARKNPIDSEGFDSEHRAFLEVSRGAPEHYVKAVLTPSTADSELDAMLVAIAAVDTGIPLILQPVTPVGSVKERPSAERIRACFDRAAAVLRDVRVIPQTHPIYGVL